MNTSFEFINKGAMRQYLSLDLPCSYIMVTYVWIDNTGVDMRSKDRTFNFIPKTNRDLPIWYFDGFASGLTRADNSDTFIYPQVIYRDPFRRGNHLIVLCDTYMSNYEPTATNNRKECLLWSGKAEVEEPWFGFNQEFTIFSLDGGILGWPTNGFPSPRGPYYCASGANKVVARDLMIAFYRCCLYAGVSLNGMNTGSVPTQWNFNVGPSKCFKAADDLWMARYILCRLAEEYGVVISFEPKPKEDWPGNGCFVYYSSKSTRAKDGMMFIENLIDKLDRKHDVHMWYYDANNGADNARRLNGQQGVPHILDFTAGIANRCCSIRIPRKVAQDEKGYLEDRRPAANADPYRVMTIMLQTCIFDQ